MVERGGLENRCALTRTQGSNPCLSAKQKRADQGKQSAFFMVE